MNSNNIEIISKFMKYKPFKTLDEINTWEEIHKIIEKIENLGFKIIIFDTQCQIEAIWDETQSLIWELEQTKKEATLNAILKFIKIYDNKVKK